MDVHLHWSLPTLPERGLISKGFEGVQERDFYHRDYAERRLSPRTDGTADEQGELCRSIPPSECSLRSRDGDRSSKRKSMEDSNNGCNDSHIGSHLDRVGQIIIFLHESGFKIVDLFVNEDLTFFKFFENF